VPIERNLQRMPIAFTSALLLGTKHCEKMFVFCRCKLSGSFLCICFCYVFFPPFFPPRLVSLSVSASISFSCSESHAEHWNFQFSMIGV